MTKVKLLYNNNMYCGFDMEGHAGFNTNGPDILCASLSAASQMTINGILDWTGIDVEDFIKVNNPTLGKLIVELPPTIDQSMTVQQLFNTFAMYIEQLAELYPENVDLVKEETDE